MAGSATFTPYSLPLDDVASVFVVSRYDRDSGEFTVLPNVRCLSIHYAEGATPPTAQFDYVLDDGDPSSPFPTQMEDLWPLAAAGPYVVPHDTEVVVVEHREGADPYLVFDGHTQVPQVDGDGGGHRVTFVAVGVAIRLWDTVIAGATYRPSSDPDAGDVFATDLPTHFNPQGRPNCTPDDNDVDKGTASARPVFLADDTDEGANGQTWWTLGKLVRYLCWTFNADETYILNPVAPRGTLDDYLVAIAPKPDAQYFDVADPSTYDTQPILIRNYDPTGKPWIEAVAELLHQNGFEVFFELLTGDAGLPLNKMILYRKDGFDAVAPRSLPMPKAIADLADGTPGFSGFGLARDAHSAANEWVVETPLVAYEASFVLAPGFSIAAADAADANIKNFDRSKVAGGTDEERRKYRYYTLDEAGLGHWDYSSATFVTGQPTSLDDVLGKPKNGVAQYGFRPRPGSTRVFALDDAKQPRKALLEISTDYLGPRPAVWDPTDTTSTWRSLGSSGWKLDEDGLGVWIATGVDNPEDWKLPKADGPQANGDQVRGIFAQASPDVKNPRFYLRLTTVIDGDRAIDAVATKRDASPSRFTIRRRVDAKDHFKKLVITKASVNNTVAKTVLVRDDGDKAKAHAEAMRSAHEFPPIAGSVSIPWISHSHGIGDAISEISGRGISLALNAGAPAGESPKYPIVVGLSWNCQLPQSTTLHLSDRRGEPGRA